MKIDFFDHERRSTRLPGYDYSRPGHYFVTILTRNRECLLGRIEDGAIILSNIGKKAFACWESIPEHFPGARLGSFVIMPNHIHGIITLLDQEQGSNSNRTKAQGGVRAQNLVPLPRLEPHPVPLPRRYSQTKHQYTRGFDHRKINQFQHIIPGSIGSVIRGFKIGVTKYCNSIGHLEPVWHRNYYERIIRSPKELNSIRQYINNNPKNWRLDKENPINI